MLGACHVVNLAVYLMLQQVLIRFLLRLVYQSAAYISEEMNLDLC